MTFDFWIIFIGDPPPDWPFYTIIHGVLGQTDRCRDDLIDDSLLDDSDFSQESSMRKSKFKFKILKWFMKFSNMWVE